MRTKIVTALLLVAGFCAPTSVTAATVTARTGPGTVFPASAAEFEGRTTVVCTVRAEPVDGNDSWARLSTGGWAPAAQFGAATGVPECDGTGAYPAGDDYPYRTDRTDNVDRWAFYRGQCTSFVAWRLEQTLGYFHNFQWHNGIPGHWGNAVDWDDNARKLGYRVDRVPVPGAVAQWESGHVAYISAVQGKTVTVEEYNWVTPLAYDIRVTTMDRISAVLHLVPGR
ncbi:CHAP domain-containing protein [Amycolatopsis saalfeldensis]|uniref:Surface antigen n=1 Tax=Amycolatopsis saalfeldensis TaxID=394193 RepID=A0A1H8Y694_9PSEU|nr:CHAP domain-containing protein [Amycolatopsis saalfeldensis]SEP47810.1 Surface antigen [Amycolatopsis saalfeldensis]